MAILLGIESSCDECSASLVESSDQGLRVLSLETFSQIELHVPYGGVVPEIASRNHLETINHVIQRAFQSASLAPKKVDAIAVTNRPGLVGALLVGVSAAKVLSYVWEKPLIAIHHLEGHACSLFLKNKDQYPQAYPMLLAIISGGHSNLYLITRPPELWAPDELPRSLIGRSRDDAAGEAFDKTAKLLGFPYPGGKYIDRESKNGNPHQYEFPRALPQKSTYDYSFSGLKTAVAVEIQKQKQKGTFQKELPHLCASTQEAIVDALVTKIKLAAINHSVKNIALVGGVAANSKLRSSLQELTQSLKINPIHLPEFTYCTDNAAMIAAAGSFRFQQKQFLTPQEAIKLNALANPSY
jgi:N6-L-threonylcarbamoyladenine synthase